MSKRTLVEQTDILLFKATEKLVRRNCHLKHFLNFLTHIGSEKPFRFAYVEQEGPLISNLSIIENIYLDSVPNSLTDTKDFQLKNYLEESGNEHLIDLYNSIYLLHETPDKVDNRTRKLAALLKGLLQKTTYLFLERPEKYLDHEYLELFIKAMTFQTKSRKLTVLIHSERDDIWEEHISKTITQSDGANYLIQPSTRVHSGDNIIQIEQTAVKHESDDGILKIHNIPSDHDKKAA